MIRDQLAPGDVVYLGPGSPPLTIVRLGPDHAVCALFTGKAKSTTVHPLSRLSTMPVPLPPDAQDPGDRRREPEAERPGAIAKEAWGTWCW